MQKVPIVIMKLVVVIFVIGLLVIIMSGNGEVCSTHGIRWQRIFNSRFCDYTIDIISTAAWATTMLIHFCCFFFLEQESHERAEGRGLAIIAVVSLPVILFILDAVKTIYRLF